MTEYSLSDNEMSIARQLGEQKLRALIMNSKRLELKGRGLIERAVTDRERYSAMLFWLMSRSRKQKRPALTGRAEH